MPLLLERRFEVAGIVVDVHQVILQIRVELCQSPAWISTRPVWEEPTGIRRKATLADIIYRFSTIAKY